MWGGVSRWDGALDGGANEVGDVDVQTMLLLIFSLIPYLLPFLISKLEQTEKIVHSTQPSHSTASIHHLSNDFHCESISFQISETTNLPHFSIYQVDLPT